MFLSYVLDHINRQVLDNGSRIIQLSICLRFWLCWVECGVCAFENYGKLAHDYIQEGKRLLNEELSAVEMIGWKTSLANARQHYQKKFSQLPMPELKMECQQLARDMATINKQVIALKSQ
ncbi:hypothetical protein [uncultured Photobacterium sp.]|uniref:hypothetical protein n=1 Tax=uncultured Photobacterium sp. TaxID=173973 RepID=UPI0026115775|nr:hypothetical protein [uncultured Photobacterium sp.]